jgi:16S rRNA (guanine1207-N2)-methyltransferase
MTTPDPTTTLLLEAAEVTPGSRALLLGAPDAALALEVTRRTTPGGSALVADYDQAALDRAHAALRHAGLGNAALISPDRLEELDEVSLDVALLHILPFASSALLVRVLYAAARALKPGALLYAAGPRDKGIVAVGKRLAELFGSSAPIRYGGGSRVIVAKRPAVLPAPAPSPGPEIATVELRGHTFQFELRDGVFARGGYDEGAALLAQALELRPADAVLDLGCGGGLVGMLAARLAPEGSATLLDSNTAAVELARANIARNGIANASALVSDSTAAVAGRRFDVVATNPPFHAGRVHAADIAARFIADAANVLAPGGRLLLVCNRFLPYDRAVVAAFGGVREAIGNARYRVLAAEKE